jgi:fatty-acyl-CoA synthase
MTGGGAALSIDSILARHARWRAAKTALVHDGRRITYRELATRSHRLANGLRGLGVGAGDRVAMLSTNNVTSSRAMRRERSSRRS